MKCTLALSLLTVFSFSSCTPHQQQGAAIGGIGGGLLGALSGGGDNRATTRGMMIGAAAGTAIASIQENQARQNQPYRNSPYQEQATRSTPRQDYPYAETTSRRGIVLSPYEPYHEIDVSGLRSDSLAKDPSTGEVFVVP